jgi:hypothetical protein
MIMNNHPTLRTLVLVLVLGLLAGAPAFAGPVLGPVEIPPVDGPGL